MTDIIGFLRFFSNFYRNLARIIIAHHFPRIFRQCTSLMFFLIRELNDIYTLSSGFFNVSETIENSIEFKPIFLRERLPLICRWTEFKNSSFCMVITVYGFDVVHQNKVLMHLVHFFFSCDI